MTIRKTAALLLVVAALVAALIMGGTAYAIDAENPDDEAFAADVFTANIIAGFPELALTVEMVQALRDADYGWGEIVIACGIAVNSGQTLDSVIALANEGAGWGEIAKQLGVPETAFGHYVRGIMGKGGPKAKERRGRKQLDDAVAMDVVCERFGLRESDVEALFSAGMDAQDVLCAVSIAAAVGDASRVSLVLELRARQENWVKIAEAVGVAGDAVIRQGVHVRNRVEFQNALKAMIRERVWSGDRTNMGKGKGHPEDQGKGKGPGGNGDGPGSPGSQGKAGS
ncbi:MAG: hypothetical protein NUW12_05485 [Firmicutes bacterium]|jgi:hypothetical protein|nr:hypothetical protein [Bacillota bacterium]MDH7495575.1 hypothetical protein [Bacillota bacterium]